MVTHKTDYARHATRRINLFDGRVIDETVERSTAPLSASAGEA
jgi:ABC-type lipoprotein export system ATPase subunit